MCLFGYNLISVTKYTLKKYNIVVRFYAIVTQWKGDFSVKRALVMIGHVTF